MIVLPLITLFGIVGILLTGRVVEGWRTALLLAAAFLAAVTMVGTELLSLCHGVTPINIRLLWWGLCAASLLGLWGCSHAQGRGLPVVTWPQFKGWRVEQVLLGICVLLALALCVIGIISPPNNWDSMTYHLPRVMHWLQNASVAYYPTESLRQNSYPPGAEILLLHAYALAGSDRWVNALQWLSFIGCALGGSFIAQKFGAGTRGQISAMIFALTVPMAILQSVSTQNDLVVAFWVVCAAALVLELMDKWSLPVLLGIGLAFGLALVTKGTGAILVPFILWGLVAVIRRGGLKRAGMFLIVVCTGVGLVAGGYATREYLTYTRTSQAVASDLVMGRRDLVAVISNILRNAGSEMAIPSAPFNRGLVRWVKDVHGALGISSADPLTTQSGDFGLPSAGLSFHEDYAPSPVHALWAMAAFLFVMLYFFRSRAALFLAALVTAALLFCVMVKWQPWITRFHVPFFMLTAPLAGLAAERWRMVTIIFMMITVVYGGVVIVRNLRHPLTGQVNVFSDRRAQIFIERGDLARPYLIATEVLRKTGCRSVGLISHGEIWEYPLWALTRDQGVSFRPVMVPGGPDGIHDACAIFDAKSPHEGPADRIWGGVPFRRVFASDRLSVYLRLRQ